jgi:hypothetical protein
MHFAMKLCVCVCAGIMSERVVRSGVGMWRVCTACPHPMQENKAHIFINDRIVPGTLSLREFSMCWGRSGSAVFSCRQE